MITSTACVDLNAFAMTRGQCLHLLLGLCIGLAARAQSDGHFIKGRSYRSDELVIPGWKVLDSLRIDLGLDSLKDLAMVFERLDSALIVDDEFGSEDSMYVHPRCLAVFTASTSGTTFTLLDQNEHFVPLDYEDVRSDPFQGLEPASDSLVMHCLDWRSMGSWWMTSWSYMFVVQDHQLRLTGAKMGSMHRATHEGEDYTFDFASGTYTLVKNAELSPDGKGEMVHGKLPTVEMRTLGTMPKQGTWEILPGVFL